MIYANRRHAGEVLAEKLVGRYANRPDGIVLGLPRGGVPVAYEVARALHVRLDIFIVRKLGLPGHEELAMGAIASGGTLVLNEDLIKALGVPAEMIRAVAAQEMKELLRREREYRAGYEPADLRNCSLILVDDGLATGASMRAAARALRQKQPSRIVVAVPVAARETCEEFRAEVDEIICAQTPEPFHGVGLWYEDFSQTTDAEVRELLASSRDLSRQSYGEDRLEKAA